MTPRKPMKARPTLYKGIQMRSRLEAGFAAWLDKHKFNWEYEPCAFAHENGQYLPDFRLTNVAVSWDLRPKTVYVEVKPDIFMADEHKVEDEGRVKIKLWQADRRKASEQAAVIAANDPDAIFLLAQPGRASVFLHDGNAECHWPFSVIFTQSYLGVALALRETGPWNGQYWASDGGDDGPSMLDEHFLGYIDHLMDNGVMDRIVFEQTGKRRHNPNA